MVPMRRPGGRDRGASPAGAGQAAGANRAEEVLPHRRQLRRPPRGTAGRRLVAPGAQGDRVLPERRRDHRPGLRHRLPGRADQGTRLRARARDHHRQGRQVLRPGRRRGLRRGVHGLQRHHRPRHPAPGDAVRRVLVLQGDRHLLPDRPVDRDRRRGARRPGSGHGTPGQRPGTAARQHGQDAHLHPAPGRVPLGAGLLGRGHPHHRDDLGRGRGPAQPVRVLPAARRQHRGRDRAGRRAPQPRRAVGRRAQHPPVLHRPLLLSQLNQETGHTKEPGGERMTRRLHVLIAGGGLSGLALAQGLLKDGHTCEVFERDADDSRKIGYYLHMNADGGEALRRCLPGDLFELYAQTSRRTYDRRESVVLDDQLNELSSQPHLGPPNEGERPHTGVHRRTLRAILRARLGDAFHPGQPVTGYEETPGNVTVTLADGDTAQGDVLVGADGIRSAVRGQKLPGTTVIDTGVRGLGVFGRTPLTPELARLLPPHLFEGVIIAADRTGSRLLIAVYRPRQRPQDAAAALAPDVTLEPVEDYVMISCSVAPGTVIPPAAQWTDGTPPMLRDAMLGAIEGWHPAARALVANVDLASIFVIPFGFLEPAPPWEPSRVTLVGDAAHAMLPTLGLGANLALRDAAHLLGQLSAAARGEEALVPAIGAYEQGMRDYVYPFMRMTMEHDKQFGGGALEGR